MAAHSSILGESHGQRSLAGYSPRGQKDLDTTETTVSVVQQSNVFIRIYVYIYIKKLFPIIVCYRILDIVPCAIQ